MKSFWFFPFVAFLWSAMIQPGVAQQLPPLIKPCTAQLGGKIPWHLILSSVVFFASWIDSAVLADYCKYTAQCCFGFCRSTGNLATCILSVWMWFIPLYVYGFWNLDEKQLMYLSSSCSPTPRQLELMFPPRRSWLSQQKRYQNTDFKEGVAYSIEGEIFWGDLCLICYLSKCIDILEGRSRSTFSNDHWGYWYGGTKVRLGGFCISSLASWGNFTLLFPSALAWFCYR